MNEAWTQLGIYGVIIGALARYIIIIEKRHEKERGESRDTSKEQFKEMNKTIKDNTDVLSGLKTLLENRR